MYTSIQKWGHSGAVRIPKPVLDALQLNENDRVEIFSDESKIVIRPVKRRYASLDELFEGYDGNCICTEAGTGIVGREIL